MTHKDPQIQKEMEAVWKSGSSKFSRPVGIYYDQTTDEIHLLCHILGFGTHTIERIYSRHHTDCFGRKRDWPMYTRTDYHDPSLSTEDIV